MPTTIDSLLVTLGLDASKFTAGQKAAVAALKQTSEEARARGKEIEDSARRSSAFFSRLRGEAVGLFAALAGANGIQAFVFNMTNADAATGRLSRNIGVSINTISKWQGLARVAGGDAAQMAQSFQNISDVFAGWKIGIINPLVADFRAISTAGGKIIDVNKGVEQSFLDLSENLQKIHARDPATAGLLGRRAGIAPELYDILIKGPAAVQAMLAEVNKLGVATDKSAAEAQKFQSAWAKAALAIEDTGRHLLTRATPLFSRALEIIAKAFSFHADLSSVTGGAAGAPGSSGSGLPLKAGATAGGDTSLGIWALAHTLGPDVIKRISATNDLSHSGGKHRDGLAMDFTINDPRRSAEIASKLRARLGDDATVLDEYLKPSKNATGPHIHVQFNSPEAAQRFAAAAGTPSGPTSTATTDVRIGTINVNTQASDAAGIARDLPAAIRERQSLGGLGNVTGSQ